MYRYYRPNGFRDDPSIDRELAPAIDDELADEMAMKNVMLHNTGGGAPLITVSSIPEPPREPPKDVHVYHYHPEHGVANGSSPRPGPPAAASDSGQSYMVIGSIEYGRLTSIDPSRSTPGVNLPSRVLAELQSVYATVPHAMVIVMNHHGKFTIQAQLVSQMGNSMPNQMPHQGMMPPPQPQPQPYHQLPQPPILQQPQVQPLVLGGPMIRPGLPGQPIIVYPSPRPRKKERDQETIYVDVSSDDSDEDFEKRHVVGARRRRMKRTSQLKKRHEELYQDDDGVYRRQKDDFDDESIDGDYRRSGRDTDRRRRDDDRRRDDRRGRDDDRRDRNGGNTARSSSPKGIYRIGTKDDRRNRNSNQARVLSEHGKR